MKLHVLWTTGDKEVAIKVIFSYIINSKANGWWDEVNLIIWGPSSKLAALDPDVIRELQMAIDSGITVEACIACSTTYGLVEIFNSRGIPMIHMGDPFTRYLKSNDKVIIF